MILQLPVLSGAHNLGIDLKLLRTDFERIAGLLIADLKNKGVLK